MEINPQRYCVIMCGGSGSRFWPFSRNEKPKQFLDFFGTGRSLLQLTVDRIKPMIDIKNIILVTNEAYEAIIKEQLPELPVENILCEPARRNTAPCVCWAANHIYAKDPEAVIVTLPSDHLVLKEEEFRMAIDECMSFCNEKRDCMMTLGIKPTFANTGYGYIQLGDCIAEHTDIRKVKSFTEKPNEEMATLFVQSGEFFWNSGIFIWSAEAILNAFEQLAPEIYSAFVPGRGYYATTLEREFVKSVYSSVPSISVDYAIMEKAGSVFVKPVDIGWSDLGTWKALYEISPHNQQRNVTQNCKVMTTDCENSIFAVEGDKIVVASGLQDYIVADNGNALLIYPLKEEQNIRKIVNDVKSHFGDKYV